MGEAPRAFWGAWALAWLFLVLCFASCHEVCLSRSSHLGSLLSARHIRLPSSLPEEPGATDAHLEAHRAIPLHARDGRASPARPRFGRPLASGCHPASVASALLNSRRGPCPPAPDCGGLHRLPDAKPAVRSRRGKPKCLTLFRPRPSYGWRFSSSPKGGCACPESGLGPVVLCHIWRRIVDGRGACYTVAPRTRRTPRPPEDRPFRTGSPQDDPPRYPGPGTWPQCPQTRIRSRVPRAHGRRADE